MSRLAIPCDHRLVVLLFSAVLITACSPPRPPDEQQRPEPQAQGTQASSGIVEHANAYKERARNAEAQQQAAAEQQRAQIDAATR
jgi:outer membrane biogenesis lipoprotein LolB